MCFQMNGAETEKVATTAESKAAATTTSNSDAAVIDTKPDEPAKVDEAKPETKAEATEAGGEEDEEEKKKKPTIKDKLLKTFNLGPLTKRRASKDAATEEGKAEGKEGEPEAEEAKHNEAVEKKDEEKHANVEAVPVAKADEKVPEDPSKESAQEKKADQ